MVKFIKGARVNQRLATSSLSLGIASADASSNSGWGDGDLGRHCGGRPFYNEMLRNRRSVIYGELDNQKVAADVFLWCVLSVSKVELKEWGCQGSFSTILTTLRVAARV